MNSTPHQELPHDTKRAESRSTDELVDRFLEMELAEADEGLTERSLVEMLARESPARPSRCFAGNVIRRLEEQERAASCWSQRAMFTVVATAIALCGSGVLLLARLAGLPTAPGLEWLPIFSNAWSTALEAPSVVAALLAGLGGSWADAQSAVEWAYSPELLLLAGAALSVATLALGALARLMGLQGQPFSDDLQPQVGELKPVEVEAAG